MQRKYLIVLFLLTDCNRVHLILFRYNDIPDKWEAPTLQPFPERPNLQYFLMEPDSFDQYYVYNTNSHIEVWLNSNPQPTKLVEREVSVIRYFL